jgi:hypothetical protein
MLVKRARLSAARLRMRCRARTGRGCGKHATAVKINAQEHLLFLVGYFPQSAFIFFHLASFLCSISLIFADISTNQLMVGKNIRYNGFHH